MYGWIARRAAGLLLLCGIASPASAGINEWTRIGPEAAQVCALAAAPAAGFRGPAAPPARP